MTNQVDILSLPSDNNLTPKKITELISQKISFEITDIKDMSFTIKKLERAIKEQGMRSRVYTEYRSAAVTTAAVPLVVTQAIGITTALGIGLHNLITINPDYEIGKNKVMGRLTIMYKKD